MEERKNIPLEDRQTALALLLELALQRGTLQHILGAVLLLLQLSGSICRYRCNKMQLKSEEEETKKKLPEYTKSPPPKSEYNPPSNENDRGYPLVPFLRRLGDIPTPQSPYTGFQKSDTVSCAMVQIVCPQESLLNSILHNIRIMEYDVRALMLTHKHMHACIYAPHMHMPTLLLNSPSPHTPTHDVIHT